MASRVSPLPIRDTLAFLGFILTSLISSIILSIYFSISVPNGMAFNLPPFLRTLMGRGLAPHGGVLTVQALVGGRPLSSSLPWWFFTIIAQTATATLVIWLLFTFLPNIGVFEGKADAVATLLPTLPERSDEEMASLLVTDFGTELLASACE